MHRHTVCRYTMWMSQIMRLTQRITRTLAKESYLKLVDPKGDPRNPCYVYVKHPEPYYAVLLGMCNAGLLDHSD